MEMSSRFSVKREEDVRSLASQLAGCFGLEHEEHLEAAAAFCAENLLQPLQPSHLQRTPADVHELFAATAKKMRVHGRSSKAHALLNGIANARTFLPEQTWIDSAMLLLHLAFAPERQAIHHDAALLRQRARSESMLAPVRSHEMALPTTSATTLRDEVWEAQKSSLDDWLNESFSSSSSSSGESVSSVIFFDVEDAIEEPRNPDRLPTSFAAETPSIEWASDAITGIPSFSSSSPMHEAGLTRFVAFLLQGHVSEELFETSAFISLRRDVSLGQVSNLTLKGMLEPVLRTSLELIQARSVFEKYMGDLHHPAFQAAAKTCRAIDLEMLDSQNEETLLLPFLKFFRNKVQNRAHVLVTVGKLLHLQPTLVNFLDEVEKLTLQEKYVGHEPKLFLRILLATMCAQLKIFRRVLHTGELEQDVEEEFIADFAASPWAPVSRELDKSSRSIYMLSRLAVDNNLAWPPWENDHFDLLWNRSIGEETDLEQKIYQPMKVICAEIGKQAVKHAIARYGLLQKLKSVRWIYLLPGEYYLQQFLKHLFVAVDRDIPDKHPIVNASLRSFLEDEMNDCRIPERCLMSPHASDFLSQLLESDLGPKGLESVRFAFVPPLERDRFSLNGVHSLSACRVTFRIGAPLDMIIDQHVCGQYSAIFTFLLQIKRVFVVLCQLQHSLRQSKFRHKSLREKRQVHMVTLMLMQHLHFVNNLHSYVMHRLVELDWDSLESATSIDELAIMHQRMLSDVCTRCLISPLEPEKETRVMQAILELLESSLTFRNWSVCLWEAIKRGEVGDSAEDLEKRMNFSHARFSRTYRFLLTLLTQRQALGGMKHLEEVLVRLDFNKEFQRQAF